MLARPWQHRTAAAFALFLLISALTTWADPEGERYSHIQDGLDVGSGHLAAAVVALLEPTDLPSAEAAMGEAVTAVGNVLGWLRGQPAVGTDRQARVLLRQLSGCQRQLHHARDVLGRADSGSTAAREATTQAAKALAAVSRAFARVQTLGPLLVLTERVPDRYGLYSAGESAWFVVRSLDGTGAPCEPLEVTVSGDRAGVVSTTVTPVSTTPLVFSVSLGSSRGIAEVTVLGCGKLRRAYVVNRGRGSSEAVGTELLAVVDTPANLTTAGSDWLCWSDGTDDPVKIMPRSGGTVAALATRLEAPERLIASGNYLYLIDIRSGHAPDGSVGSAVIRVLKRADLTGPGVTQLGYGGNAAAQTTTDIVVADGYVYWVVSRNSPTAYTIQRIPVDGGAPVDLYTSAWNAITAMAADATHLYWVETAFPDPGTIRRLPLAGGDAEVFYSSPTPIGGGLSVRADQLYVADLFNRRLAALPLAGGPPRYLANTPMPRRLVTDELNLYWIDDDALRTVPLAGGEVSTLAAGLHSPRDLCVDGEEVFWAESDDDAHDGRGTVSKVARGGGPVSVLAAGVRTPVAVAVAGDTVHWCEGGPSAGIGGYGRVAHSARAGGPIAPTLRGISQSLPAIAADATAVYVADRWTVKRLALDGTASDDLASAGFYIASVATDGTRVAWVQSDPFGTVSCVPVTGGAVQGIGALNDYAGRLTLDAVYAYAVGGLDQIQRFPLTGPPGGAALPTDGLVDDLLATGGVLCYADISGNAVRRTSPTGAGTAWLAGFPASDWSCRLASDGLTLYWLTSSTLGRVPLGGGLGRIVQNNLPSDPNQTVPNSIAIDNDCVYWTAILGDDTGLIFRTALRRSTPVRREMR